MSKKTKTPFEFFIDVAKMAAHSVPLSGTKEQAATAAWSDEDIKNKASQLAADADIPTTKMVEVERSTESRWDGSQVKLQSGWREEPRTEEEIAGDRRWIAEKEEARLGRERDYARSEMEAGRVRCPALDLELWSTMTPDEFLKPVLPLLLKEETPAKIAEIEKLRVFRESGNLFGPLVEICQDVWDEVLRGIDAAKPLDSGLTNWRRVDLELDLYIISKIYLYPANRNKYIKKLLKGALADEGIF